MSLKASFVSFLRQKHPAFDPQQTESLISDNLLSPFQVPLTAEQVRKLRTEIGRYWRLRGWGERHLSARYDELGLRRPRNYSACMSYDFHLNPRGEPELIEINTNASFLALGLELYDFLNLPNIAGTFDERALVEMFRRESQLAHGNTGVLPADGNGGPADGSAGFSVAILDEKPAEQRLYIEFLLYRALFRKYGVRSEIFDTTRAPELAGLTEFSLVYNRYTDFYLSEPRSAGLRAWYNDGTLELSPQPYDYFLLADKERLLDWNLMDWTAPNAGERPASLLPIYDLGHTDRDFIWSQRKNLFFKPKHSFGGKQAYKGGSISRRVFEEVSNDSFVAQQFSDPAVLRVELGGQPQDFKYDLRCFAYGDELQLIVARLYQGQTTNLKTPGGGFAAVVLAI